MNLLSRREHQKGFPQKRPQLILLNGFLFVCNFKWSFKLQYVLKHILQISHWKDFLPVCYRMCLVKLLEFVRYLSQASHWKGFSPVSFRFRTFNSLKHISQVWFLSKNFYILPNIIVVFCWILPHKTNFVINYRYL